MDVTEDQEGGNDDDTPIDAGDDEVPNGESKRYPTKLRGRGGFGHVRGTVRGGRGGRGSLTATETSNSSPSAPPAAKDPMETLASSMSALQFVPHSVRIARGRASGRGG